MNILIPTTYNKNPYVYQLVKALQKREEVNTVQTLVPWLFQNDYHFDIIHLQWPESIISKKFLDAKNIAYVSNSLSEWKHRGTKLVATIHNDMPHLDKSKKAYQFYSMIYEKCDGIHHMGENSRQVIHNNYTIDTSHITEIVIKHGNYDCFQNNISRSESRKNLSIPDNTLTVACIGTIRTKEEYWLLHKFRKALKKHSGILLHVGSINPPYGFIKRHLRRRALTSKKNYKHYGSYVEDNKIQLFLNACDIFLIPRVNSLNSGNVALGYTFGKLVVGPNFGVIGEELRYNENPVFKNTSQTEINSVLDEAVSLLNTEICIKNEKYAQNELDWNKLAAEYISFYHTLSKTNSTSNDKSNIAEHDI